MKNLLVKVFLFLPLLLSPASGLAQNTPATVVSIGDGDTLRIRQSGQVTNNKQQSGYLALMPQSAPKLFGGNNQLLGSSNCYLLVRRYKFER